MCGRIGYYFRYTLLLTLDHIKSEEWQEYVTHSLRDTRERDRQTLGGIRPDNYGQQNTNVALPMIDGDLPTSKFDIPKTSTTDNQTSTLSVNESNSYNDQV